MGSPSTLLNPMPQGPRFVNPDGSLTEEAYWFLLTMLNVTQNNEAASSNPFAPPAPSGDTPAVQALERLLAFQPGANAQASVVSQSVQALQSAAAFRAQASGLLQRVADLQRAIAFRPQWPNASEVNSGYIPASALVLASNALRQIIAAVLASGKIWIGQASGLPAAESLSGDATLVASGALTLATVNPDVGTYGDATHVAQVTVDAKGRTTAVLSVSITGVPPGGPAGGDLSGTYPNPIVSQVNGAVVPAIASLVGTNSSSQLVAEPNPVVTSLTLTPSTIAALPGAPTKGQFATVNNALAPVIGSAVGGTGTAFAAVCWNGSQWTVFSI